jgi:hypothetical protein
VLAVALSRKIGAGQFGIFQQHRPMRSWSVRPGPCITLGLDSAREDRHISYRVPPRHAEIHQQAAAPPRDYISINASFTVSRVSSHLL